MVREISRLTDSLHDYFFDIAAGNPPDDLNLEKINETARHMGMPEFLDPLFKPRLEREGYFFDTVRGPGGQESVIYGNVVPADGFSLDASGKSILYLNRAATGFTGIHPGFQAHWDPAFSRIWVTDRVICDLTGLQEFWQSNYQRYKELAKGHDLTQAAPYYATMFDFLGLHEGLAKMVKKLSGSQQDMSSIAVATSCLREYVNEYTAFVASFGGRNGYEIPTDEFVSRYVDAIKESGSLVYRLALLNPGKEAWNVEQKKEVARRVSKSIHN